MINAARELARQCDVETLAGKVQFGPLPGHVDREGFLVEVDGLRAELSAAVPFHPGMAVAAAHDAIRAAIPFLDRDRALDGEVATAVRLVVDGSVLAASRASLAK